MWLVPLPPATPFFKQRYGHSKAMPLFYKRGHSVLDKQYSLKYLRIDEKKVFIEIVSKKA